MSLLTIHYLPTQCPLLYYCFPLILVKVSRISGNCSICGVLYSITCRIKSKKGCRCNPGWIAEARGPAALVTEMGGSIQTERIKLPFPYFCSSMGLDGTHPLWWGRIYLPSLMIKMGMFLKPLSNPHLQTHLSGLSTAQWSKKPSHLYASAEPLSHSTYFCMKESPKLDGYLSNL